MHDNPELNCGFVFGPAARRACIRDAIRLPMSVTKTFSKELNGHSFSHCNSLAKVYVTHTPVQ